MSVGEITLGADPASGEGGVTVPVYPQRHAYLINRLGKFFSGLVETGQTISVDNLLDIAGSQSYELLTALVPNLSKRMSEWEFRGFASAAAMQAGEYDPALDTTSPSIPEIRIAVKMAGEVNGLDIIRHLKGAFGLVDPTLLRAMVSEQLMGLMDSASMTLPSSLSESGDSPLTTSGTTPPVATENVASPSLA